MDKEQHEIGFEILELIGLPSGLCNGFVINCPCDKMWTVSAEYIISNDKKGELKKIIAKHNLVVESNAERID